MFDLEEFQRYPLLYPVVQKLNKYIIKKNESKIQKQIKELEELFNNKELLTPITFILSIIAENNPDTITEDLIRIIIPFLKYDNEKLRINSILIIGFFSKYYFDLGDTYIPILIENLTDSSEDVRINIHYFLNELFKHKEYINLLDENVLFNSLSLERNQENITSLLSYLEKLPGIRFKNLLFLRTILLDLISRFQESKTPISLSLFISLIRKYFPITNDVDQQISDLVAVRDFLKNVYLMDRLEFDYKNNDWSHFREFLSNYKKSVNEDEIFYVYFLNRVEEKIIFLQLEKEKTINFFEKQKRYSWKKLIKTFQIIKTKDEFDSFIKILTKLNFIKGYFSELGYYYPHNYIKRELSHIYQEKGYFNLNDFNFLPKEIVLNAFKELVQEKQEEVLLGKNQKVYYSLDRIKKRINSKATKISSINLKKYRDILQDTDFIKLVKNLPMDYLTKYHKGTHWLTNLGRTRIEKEIENSKLVGFFNIPLISNKLGINDLLLLDIFDLCIDNRSGIYDKNKEIFYYSKYVNQKIKEIKLIASEVEKKEKIKVLAENLNISEDQLINKIDENLQLIGEEIKNKDQIRVSQYLEKTGMDPTKFFDFIESLELKFLIKGDYLVIDPRKIKEAEDEIQQRIIDKTKSSEYFSMNEFDVSSKIIQDLIIRLLNDEKLIGIFYKKYDNEIFYTERGIQKLMIENSFLFSFHDLFYGKELSEKEINILKRVFNELRKNKTLYGEFDETNLSFSSNDVLFANDYNSYLYQFQKIVNNYIQIFNDEFNKIKKVLTKKDTTIFPQEIKTIQEIIDNMNEKYVRWRNNIDSFINSASKKLLGAQGFSFKKYHSFTTTEDKKDIKFFKEDPEVLDLLEDFKTWVKIFNDLELKYPNVIYYQKRLASNQEDKNLKEKYNTLLEELYLM